MRLKVKKTSSVDLLAKLQEAAKNTDELMQMQRQIMSALWRLKNRQW